MKELMKKLGFRLLCQKRLDKRSLFLNCSDLYSTEEEVEYYNSDDDSIYHKFQMYSPRDANCLTDEQKALRLVYNAFVKLENNGASWLGASPTLTRIKLEGAIKSILHLKMNWSQFDNLYSYINQNKGKGKSGYITFDEFEKAFASYEIKRNVSGEKREGHAIFQVIEVLENRELLEDITRLKQLFDSIICTFMNHNVPLKDYMLCFDHNGDGFISAYELGSLLKMLSIGRKGKANHEKKISNMNSYTFKRSDVLLLMNAMDYSLDKKISISEFKLFLCSYFSNQIKQNSIALQNLENSLYSEFQSQVKMPSKKMILQDFETFLLSHKEWIILSSESKALKNKVASNFTKREREECNELNHSALMKSPFSRLFEVMGLNANTSNSINSSIDKKVDKNNIKRTQISSTISKISGETKSLSNIMSDSGGKEHLKNITLDCLRKKTKKEKSSSTTMWKGKQFDGRGAVLYSKLCRHALPSKDGKILSIPLVRKIDNIDIKNTCNVNLFMESGKLINRAKS